MNWHCPKCGETLQVSPHDQATTSTLVEVCQSCFDRYRQGLAEIGILVTQIAGGRCWLFGSPASTANDYARPHPARDEGAAVSKLYRNLSTPENRKWWADVKRIAEHVDTWPCWMRLQPMCDGCKNNTGCTTAKFQSPDAAKENE